MSNLVTSLVSSLRSWIQTPVVFAMAIAMFGVCIGASVAAYGFLNAVLLRPLPVENPHEIMRIAGTTSAYPSRNLPAGVFYDLLEHSEALSESFFDRLHRGVNFQSGESAVLVTACEVSGNYFNALRVGALRGRTVAPDDDRPGAAPVVVVSERFWRDRFDAREDFVGSLVLLNARPTTVIGVIPARFRGTFRMANTDVWFPHQQTFVDWQVRARGALNNRFMLRLREGMNAVEIQSQLDDFVAQMFSPESHYSYLLRPEREIELGGRESLARQSYFILGVLLILLLIGCANVSNILLAKVNARRSELAMRRALGAHPGSIFGLLIIDGVVIAVLGGLLGVLCALLFAKGFSGLGMEVPAGGAFDVRVLLFLVTITLVVGFMCGMIPAFNAARTEINAVLKESSRTSTRFRTGMMLILLQLAFSLVILIACGLFIRSLQEAQRVEPNIRMENLLSFSLNLNNLGGYELDDRIAFQRRLTEELDAHPDVISAGISSYRPLQGAYLAVMPDPQFDFLKGSDQFQVRLAFISPGFLETIGVPLIAGRTVTFDEAKLTAQRRGVVVINEAMANRFWPGENPIGREFIPWGGTGGEWRFRVIGVCGDFRDHLRQPPRPLYMLADSQDSFVVAVHTRIDPEMMKPRILEFMRDFEPRLPVQELRTIVESYRKSLDPVRTGFKIMLMIGVLGLTISMIGIYAALSNWIRRSTREIGLRIALGAPPKTITRMYMRRGASIVLAGLLLGLALASLAMPYARDLFYEVSPWDPVTLGVVPGVLFVVALLSCYLSARHATRVDPMVALRSE